MSGVSAVLSVALGFADGSERRRDVDWSLLGRGGPLSPSLAPQQTPFSAEAVALARAAGPLDWVARGAVNRPVSQGRCGTCAQFSATADVEAQWFLHGHALLKLSEQEMTDCASYAGPYGMNWVASVHKGLALNSTYPLANHSDPTLAGCRGPCQRAEADPRLSVARIDGATCMKEGVGHVPSGAEQMIAWLQYGPPRSVSLHACSMGTTAA